MKDKILSVLVFIFFSGAAFGQELSFPEIEGFKKYTNYPVYTPENLWDFINGAADNYLANGFVDLNVAEYKKGKNAEWEKFTKKISNLKDTVTIGIIGKAKFK